jgi:hypothetical protein
MRINCPNCGFARDINEEAIPASSAFATCPKCAVRFRFRADPQEAGAEREIWDTLEKLEEAPEEPVRKPAARENENGPAEPEEEARRAYQRAAAQGRGIPLLSPGGSVPWECQGGFMTPKGLISTVVLIAKETRRFFSGINPFSSVIPAWAFLLLSYAPVIIMNALHFQQVQPFLTGGEAQSAEIAAQVGIPQLLGMSVLMITIYHLISCIFVYIALRFTAPERAGFRLTFKAMAYANLPKLLLILPLVGFWLSLIFSLLLLLLCIRYTYKLSWSKTALTLTPYLLFTIIAVVQIMQFLMNLAQNAPI